MNRGAKMLPIGAGYLVDTGQIVGIFDLDKTTYGKNTREFLAAAQKSGQVIAAGDELPKSFLVCEKNGTKTVYLSQLASSTLIGRLERDEIPFRPDI